VEICQAGGYAAILDMNEELAKEVVKEWPVNTKFFEANVLETKSIAAAVKGALEWVKETGKEVGGVIAAAGVSAPAKVSFVPSKLTMCLTNIRSSIVMEIRLAWTTLTLS
jgi:3-hydroxyacyl-CoA dehydrogenase/3-hydroxy-2-methylbutyryl-CoA dehydrogenase